ncbi:Fe-S protein assembly co-chaperone HscB [Granulosicoccus sp. 3-233]|uniref:Fe-S protein assembly co-chaperone HscB n=1 Tax=Granulosicoccus sp. 3-233 TaxID=3417969 RepID=UPI003D32727D
MQVDLSSSFFDLFGLPVQFAIDESTLIARFQDLQRQLHPDRFASKPAAERRWSMQAASHVNEGYQTLKHDLKRAIYLLTLNGVSVDEETDTQMSPMFLMEQMEYREALEAAEAAADPLEKLDAVRGQLKAGVREQMQNFDQAAGAGNWDEARTTVRQWQFLDKLAREVKSMEERLDA